MNLSDLVGGKVPDYIEYGWVTAPNTASQVLPQNTVATLSCTNLVANTGNLPVVAPVNNSQFTLPAGTYNFEAHTLIVGANNDFAGILLLYNVTDNTYVSKSSRNALGSTSYDCTVEITGQFVITQNKTFELRIIARSSFQDPAVRSGGVNLFTATDAGLDQRTTIKLWKLK